MQCFVLYGQKGRNCTAGMLSVEGRLNHSESARFVLSRKVQGIGTHAVSCWNVDADSLMMVLDVTIVHRTPSSSCRTWTPIRQAASWFLSPIVNVSTLPITAAFGLLLELYHAKLQFPNFQLGLRLPQFSIDLFSRSLARSACT